jgi:hypothetical protein
MPGQLRNTPAIMGWRTVFTAGPRSLSTHVSDALSGHLAGHLGMHWPGPFYGFALAK